MSSESKTRILHQNLDTSFVNLWSLLRNLSQRGFIGRVRVELKDYTADVFMTGSNTPLVHEVDREAGTETFEEGALHRLVLRARSAPGSISVFEGAEEAVAVRRPPPPKPDDGEKGLTEPAPAPSVEVAPLVIDPPAALEPIVVPRVSETPEANPATDAIERGNPLGEDESAGTIEWNDIVKVSGELIAGVERALHGVGADFGALFRATRLELADDYTFLDPLSDGFAYSNSVVTLAGAGPDSSYVAGLRRVRERVALELALLARKRRELLARSGFRAQLDRIAGTKVI